MKNKYIFSILNILIIDKPISILYFDTIDLSLCTKWYDDENTNRRYWICESMHPMGTIGNRTTYRICLTNTWLRCSYNNIKRIHFAVVFCEKVVCNLYEKS